MYCGKTTLGRELARRLGYDFVDTDQLFLETYHITIPLFFRKYDESAFRILERKILHSTESRDNVVIATGGGTPCFFDNIGWMRAHGFVIHISLEVEQILRRATLSKNPRPLLQGMTLQEREQFVRRQLDSRNLYYHQAHISCSGDVENCEALLPLLPPEVRHSDL